MSTQKRRIKKKYNEVGRLKNSSVYFMDAGINQMRLCPECRGKLRLITLWTPAEIEPLCVKRCERCYAWFTNDKHAKRKTENMQRHGICFTQHQWRKARDKTIPRKDQHNHAPKIHLCASASSEIPSSAVTILHMQIWPPSPPHEIGYVILVDDYKDRDPSQGRYWIDRSIGKTLLLRWMTGKKNFKLDDGTRCHIIDSFETSKTKIYKDAYRLYFNTSCDPYPLILYNQRTIAEKYSNDFECVTLFVRRWGSAEPVMLNAYYCSYTMDYFMNEESYKLAVQKYGPLLVSLRRIETAYGLSNAHGFESLNPMSELAIYGYSVSKNAGLSDAGRQNLLKKVIDMGIMSKSSIVNHLEWLIYMDSPSWKDAKDLWRMDLNFVNQYHIEDQRKIWLGGYR